MSRLRDIAKGQQCQVRFPDVCNGNPETTVLAHRNGGGMALKQTDIQGAHACSDCHDVVDGRRKKSNQGFDITQTAVKIYFHDGVERTQEWLHENGYLTWDGDTASLKDARATERRAGWLKRALRKLA